MDKKTQVELEKPAKVYQVDALHSELVAVKDLLVTQNIMLQGMATIGYLQETIKNQDEKFNAKLEIIRQEYRPVLGSAKWAARAAIGAFITLTIAIIVAHFKTK